MELCLCGSGKTRDKCHGNISNSSLRNIVKYDILDNVATDKVNIGCLFQPQDFEQNTFTCDVRFVKTTTPAGIIFYPLFISSKDRALRPLSVDGLSYYEDGTKNIVAISCMVTPLSSANIFIDLSEVKTKDKFTYYSRCVMKTRGNPFASVFALEMRNNKFIALYHHTNSLAKDKITITQQMKASKWSFQGTNELKDISYIYLTDLPVINDDIDLMQIGMENIGMEIAVISDQNQIFKLHVYRDNPLSRQQSLKIWVDTDLLAPNPLILHDIESHVRTNKYGGFSWWEVFLPSIYRIAVVPDKFLPICYSHVSSDYRIKENGYLIKLYMFQAGYGKDLLSLIRLWSESKNIFVPLYRTSRPADVGLPDPEWIDTWSRNLGSLVEKIMSRM